jgi:endonuclease YncB( thermonuclease family)
MFKLLRKIIIGFVILLLGGVAFYFLGNPVYRRGLAQKAEELQEKIKDDKKAAWSGTVVVVDALKGDRLKVNTEANQNVIVRLAGIDAPELPLDRTRKGQPLAEESRDYLAHLIKGKAADMSILGTDPDKRPLVLLSLEGTLINAKIVEAGLAEVVAETSAAIPSKLRHDIENAELKARQNRSGIWTLTNYVRPIEFRIRQRTAVGPHGSIPSPLRS